MERLLTNKSSISDIKQEMGSKRLFGNNHKGVYTVSAFHMAFTQLLFAAIKFLV